MYFELRLAKNGQVYFVLKAGNHQVVAQSQMYKDKKSALNTIDSIKNGVNADSVVKDLTEEEGE